MTDASREGEMIDKLLSAIDTMSSRLDTMERRADKQRRADARSKRRADADKEALAERPLMNDPDDPNRRYGDPKQTIADDEENMTLPDRIRAAKEMRDKLNAMEKSISAEMRAQGPLTEAEEEAMADAQAKADSVYQSFGKRCPAPLPGERLRDYRVRILRPLARHTEFSNVALDAQTGKNLDLLEDKIYADAQTFADSGGHIPEGVLLPTTRTDAAGTRMTEFKGNCSFIRQFKSPAQLATLRDPRELRLRELLMRGQV